MGDPKELKRRSLEELKALAARGAPYSRQLLRELEADPRAGAKGIHAACLRAQQRADREEQRLDRMLLHEKEAQSRGFQVVAGVDEAGRGPYAGPIVAAAVVLRQSIEGVNDSKQLSHEEREALFEIIANGGHGIGIAVVGVEFIDQQGIQPANYHAMAQAVAQLDPAPEFLLVDGFRIPGMRLPQKPLIKGDALSQSIAAASIIAKVTRDRIMLEMDVRYPGYGFARHKGYGTAEHCRRIRELGPCPIHRMSWAPVLKMTEAGMLFEWAEEV